MFDIGFSELLLCFLVALVVLGPEKLPKLARTLGRWTGQAKGYLRNLTDELDREAQLSELRKQLDDAKQAMKEGADSFRDTVKKETDSFRDTVRKETDEVHKSYQGGEHDAQPASPTPEPTDPKP
ncbi:Sec-independent protein translocase protein TatB [Solimonas marina]|uniref:Sec-independent protein translocase protein TatB n=1 Tax=Solimonas marina TaxID=2714601 RepID=A0A970B568_9GAMM|nr:Sec-independent protein translocase protein TatB [Solimonas marina]NKF21230.1 twin-arginine translocase subunit TatB [Solimonas marina]